MKIYYKKDYNDHFLLVIHKLPDEIKNNFNLSSLIFKCYSNYFFQTKYNFNDYSLLEKNQTEEIVNKIFNGKDISYKDNFFQIGDMKLARNALLYSYTLTYSQVITKRIEKSCIIRYKSPLFKHRSINLNTYAVVPRSFVLFNTEIIGSPKVIKNHGIEYYLIDNNYTSLKGHILKFAEVDINEVQYENFSPDDIVDKLYV